MPKPTPYLLTEQGMQELYKQCSWLTPNKYIPKAEAEEQTRNLRDIIELTTSVTNGVTTVEKQIVMIKKLCDMDYWGMHGAQKSKQILSALEILKKAGLLDRNHIEILSNANHLDVSQSWLAKIIVNFYSLLRQRKDLIDGFQEYLISIEVKFDLMELLDLVTRSLKHAPISINLHKQDLQWLFNTSSFLPWYLRIQDIPTRISIIQKIIENIAYFNAYGLSSKKEQYFQLISIVHDVEYIHRLIETIKDEKLLNSVFNLLLRMREDDYHLAQKFCQIILNVFHDGMNCVDAKLMEKFIATVKASPKYADYIEKTWTATNCGGMLHDKGKGSCLRDPSIRQQVESILAPPQKHPPIRFTFTPGANVTMWCNNGKGEVRQLKAGESVEVGDSQYPWEFTVKICTT